MTQPKVVLGGFARECLECHRLFESRPETAPRIFQHQHIQLRHGLNDRCLNCHDAKDRNLLRLHGTRTVGFDRSEQLCATCHGPTFRDWQAGVHGRTTGSWKSTSRGRLSCVDCHDPHHPAQKPLAPLPGPDTLRMGSPGAGHGGERSPLMPWLKSVDPSRPRTTEGRTGHE